MMRKSKLPLGASLTLLMMAASNQSHAQTTPAPAPTATPAPAQAPSEPAALQEIVVTAQRVSQSAQKTALSVDVVSVSSLAQAGVNRASDLTSAVPALHIGESGNGQQSLYIRGVGAFTPQSYTDPAVSFNFDGIAIARPSSMSGVFYDLSRVEVVKGPQGTLYGRNATAGAINVLPNQPQLGNTDGEFDLTVGEWGDVHPTGYVNVGLGENAAMRAAFSYSRHDAYQSDGTSNEDSAAGRLQYKWAPTSTLDVRLAADYAHDGGNNTGGTLMGIQNSFTGAITPSPLSRDVGFGDPKVGAILSNQYSFLAGRYFTPITGGKPYQDNNFWGVTGELNWKTGLGALTLLPSYRAANLDNNGNGFGYASLTKERDRQSSFEARFASPNEGWFRWLVGAYFFDEQINAAYSFDLSDVAPIQTLESRTTSEAGFGRVTFAPTDMLRFTGGVRVTHDHKTFDGQDRITLSICGAPQPPIPGCGGAPLMPATLDQASLFSQLQLTPIIPGQLYASTLPGAANSVFATPAVLIDSSESVTKATWHGGVEYDVAPHSMLYANVDTGYHAGGFAFATLKPTYEPETITAYSIGSKNEFLGRTLQLNLEGFYWQYKNQQIAHGGTDPSGAYVFYTDNAGQSTMKGVEGSVKWRFLPDWQVDFDVQYLDAVYKSFTYQIPAGGTNPAPVTACPFARTDATHWTINCAGETPEQAPRWSGTFGLSHTVYIDHYSLMFDFTTFFQTDAYTGFELLAVEEQKAYAQSNLAVTLKSDTGRWAVTAFVNNIQNVRPYGSSFYNGESGLIGATVGPPRTSGVSLSAKF